MNVIKVVQIRWIAQGSYTKYAQTVGYGIAGATEDLV